MLKFSKKMEYALISMLYMSQNAPKELVTAPELAENFEFPQEMIKKILQRLAKAGFLESVQGIHGGYRLKKRSQEITIAEVVRVLDGPIQIVKCVGDDNCTCKQLQTCNIKSGMKELQVRLYRFLETLTLKDLEYINSKKMKTSQKVVG